MSIYIGIIREIYLFIYLPTSIEFQEEIVPTELNIKTFVGWLGTQVYVYYIIHTLFI